ncbi:MAG: ribulose-phosphate 3-epimerase [Oscillospiraceae bacterium]|nr:ribulose-phosphate 3-epimerase [Oscillospiraceae bacterium]
MKRLEPSLLAADLYRLPAQMEAAERGGAAAWHLDIMDGHFVPNLSFGPHVCEGIRKHTALPVTAHLMVERPSRFIRPFLDAGAGAVLLHAETEPERLPELLRSVRDAGAEPGVVLRPKTPPETVLPYLPAIGRVLLMSVEPGYGGQALLPESFGRIRALRRLIERENPAVLLALDGGVTPENAPALLEAGVDVFVAGSSVFGAPDIETRCREFCGVLRHEP